MFGDRFYVAFNAFFAAFTCNNRLASLNDKIVQLERQLDFLEARVSVHVHVDAFLLFS